MNINIGEPTIAQYSITVRAQTRDFIGNHGGSNVGVWTFYVNDPLDLCTALWNKSIEYVHRDVKFTNYYCVSDCQWMDTTQTITNIDIVIWH